MTAKQSKRAQSYKYKAEMKQLLHLIVHSLYTHPEIFLRELISNASDALNKIRFRQLTDKNVLDAGADLKISIELDEKEHLFSIEDTGIGMTKDELIHKIGTVASSGTIEFLQKMQEAGQAVDESLIGQFGVGFYSVFMVADEVTIETRHADPDSTAYRWVSDGQGKFTIREIDREQRGTKIYFKLKEEAKEFSEPHRIRNIIQKYSNFVDFPIYLNNEQVNTVKALWHKSKDEITEAELEEFYKFISHDFSAPLGHLYLSLEGAVNFKALLFIPKEAPPAFFLDPDQKALHLYSSKVFIQDDCKELLPDYLRFVKGVVDTEDLPLNVSREVTQSSPVMAKIRSVLTSKLLVFLQNWADKEPEKYKTFYKAFGALFKTGVNSDFAHRDKIIELLRFESTKTEEGELISLKDYVSRMQAEQKEIYYLTGDNRDTIRRNPNLEYFIKNDIEVLLLTEPVDIIIMPSIPEYDKKPLKSIEKADVELPEEAKPEEEALNEDLAKSLLQVFKETLGDKIEDVVTSKRLVDSPVTLVVGKEGMDAQTEKMLKMMQQDYAGSKKILEVNLAHPLIKNLSRRNLASSTDPLLRKSILQLYEAALLLDGNLDSPTGFVQRMTEIMEEATKGSNQ